MPSQIQEKLMTGCIGAGLDKDEFEQDEDDNVEMLDLDNNGMATSSAIREWCQEVGAHAPRVL